MRPLAPTDRLGETPASATSVLVKQAIVVPVPFSSKEYVLPAGEYMPMYADGHGIFYASPNGVVQRDGNSERVFLGGIHFPSGPGHYYSFPSLYIDLPVFGISKLSLPEDVRQSTYGSHVVFLVNGESIE